VDERPTDSRPGARRCYARAVLSSPNPLLLLRPPTTSHPTLKSHSISPDPPQAGHAPVPPHLSQSPSYPDSTAAPTLTPVPPHALHLPPPPHSVQGFDRAVITHPSGIEAEPLAGQLFSSSPTRPTLLHGRQSGLMVTSAHAPSPLDRPAAPAPQGFCDGAQLNFLLRTSSIRGDRSRLHTAPGSGSPCRSSRHTG
jgi:hypothetical protein